MSTGWVSFIFDFMKKSAHTKQQKQIRMTAELRARFEKAQKATGLAADAFVEKLLDLHEGKSGITKAEVMAWVERQG